MSCNTECLIDLGLISKSRLTSQCAFQIDPYVSDLNIWVMSEYHRAQHFIWALEIRSLVPKLFTD